MALVIDPQRDIDRLLAALSELDVQLTHVAEDPHPHDYLRSGLELCRQTGATYLVSNAKSVEFDRLRVDEGIGVEVGSMRVEVLSTPAHPPGDVSYAVTGADGSRAVFTGGSLLYDSAGRTDLVSPELTTPLAWPSTDRSCACAPGSTRQRRCSPRMASAASARASSAPWAALH